MTPINNSYFLSSYQVCCTDFSILPSLVGCIGAPWAQQHWKLAEQESSHSLGHKVIACFEALPILGGLFVLIERIAAAVASYWQKPSPIDESSSVAKVGVGNEIIIENPSFYLFRSKQVPSKQNKGMSQEGCTGSISVEYANKMCQKLQKRAALGISFDQNSYDAQSTIIGTCTVMSLKFASTYFRLRKECKNTSPDSEIFLERISQLKVKFEVSTEKIRSKQMAYSTIAVDRSKSVDISRDKIESCVRGRDFEIDYCSKEREIAADKELWENELNALLPGVYFIRMLKPSLKNCKFEERAHSMVYVREENIAFFYDNNQGLEKMLPTGLPLYQSLLKVHNQWDIPITRLYKLRQSEELRDN